MNYSTPATRTVRVGRTMISLLDRGNIVAVVDAPTSDDPTYLSKFLVVLELGWIEYAMLPHGAYFPAGIPRCYYSKSFVLEVR